MSKITVIKRDGTQEELTLEKWQAQVAKVCKGIADVSQSMIEIKSQPHFYDGSTTREIDEITLRAIVDLIDVEANPDVGHTNYQYVAGKQRLTMLRKDVYGSYNPPHLYEIVKKNVALGFYTNELLEWYTEDDWNKMEEIIDHEKDEMYSYAAIEQLIEKYLVKNRVTKEIYETPQVRYMVAAATVFHAEEPNTARMRYIKDYYTAASDGLFTLATPVLAGLGTPTKQFSSCFPAGQKVWTINGEKNIETVEVGEKVLTHTGTYQKVLATRVQPAHQENFVKINNVYSLNDEFECTEDHLIMGIKKKHPDSINDNAPEWIRADSLEKGDYVQIPFSNYIDTRESILMSVEFPEIMEYLSLDTDNMLRKPTRNGEYDNRSYPFPNEIKLTPDLFRLLGYFAAVGSVNESTNAVRFAISKIKSIFLKDITNIIEEQFNLPCSISHHRKNDWTYVMAHSYTFKKLITSLIGDGLDTKNLHDIVMNASKENQEQFLIGCIRGGGCVSEKGLSLRMSDSHFIRQISQIMIRCDLTPVLGLIAAKNRNECIEKRRIKHGSESWCDGKVIITKHDSYKITLCIGGNYEFLQKVDKNNKLGTIKNINTKPRYSKFINGMYFANITKIESRKTNNEPVYDLQVDNVQSFTVNGVGVHNCVLIRSDDDLDSIFASGEMMAKYASKRAGIGLEIGRLRSLGAPIRGGEIQHTGMLPFLKKWFGDLRSCSQGGIRNACVHIDSYVDVLEGFEYNGREYFSGETIQVNEHDEMTVNEILFTLAYMKNDSERETYLCSLFNSDSDQY